MIKNDLMNTMIAENKNQSPSVNQRNHSSDNNGNVMKKGWEIKKLPEVCENLDSKRIPITKNVRSEGKVPYYGASGIVDYVNDYIFDDNLLLVSEDGANLLTRVYPIAFSITGKAWVNNHAHVLRFNNLNSQRFVEYYLNSIKLDEYVSGMAQPKLNQAMLSSIPISFPSLSEQKRIVEILGETFAAIDNAKANTEKNLQNAKELFESYLQNVFVNKGEDWEEKRLGDVLQKTEMIDPTKSPAKEFIYLDVSSVNKDNFQIENTTLLKGKDAPSRARKLIKTNDIIFATVRPTLKRIAIISSNYNEQVCSTGYFVMRTTEQLNYRLIFYYLQTKRFIEQMEKLQRGASYPAVTDADVKNQIIHFPKSSQQQNKVADRFDNLSIELKKLKTIYQQKLNNLEELKKSILQKAFDGELTAAI